MSATEESIPDPVLRRFPIPPPTNQAEYDVKQRRYRELTERVFLDEFLNKEYAEEFNKLKDYIRQYPVYLEGSRLIEKLQEKGIIFVNVHFHHNRHKYVVRRFACKFPYNDTTVKDLKDCIEKNWNQNQYLVEGESTLDKKDQVLFRPHTLSRFDINDINYANVVSLGSFSDESKNLVPLKNLCQQDDKDYAQIHGVDVFIVPLEEMETYKESKEQHSDDIAQKKLEALEISPHAVQVQAQEVDPRRQIGLCQKLFNPQSKRKVKVTSTMTTFMSLLNGLMIPYKEADKKQMNKMVELSKSLTLTDILYIVLMLWVSKLNNTQNLDLDSLFLLYMNPPIVPPLIAQTGGLHEQLHVVASDNPHAYGLKMPKNRIQELEETISIPIFNLKDNVKIDQPKNIVRLTFKFPIFGSDSESILKFGNSISQMMKSLNYVDSEGKRIPLEEILKTERINIIMEETFQKAYLLYSLFYGASTEKMVKMMLYFQKDPSIFELVMGGSRKKNNKKTKRTKNTKRTKKTKRTKRA